MVWKAWEAQPTEIKPALMWMELWEQGRQVVPIEINAFVKGRMSSQGIGLAKKYHCDAGMCMQENLVFSHQAMWVQTPFFFSKGCQEIEANVEKG